MIEGKINKAKEFVIRNEDAIYNNLIESEIMFEDQFDTRLSREIESVVPSAIEKYFDLDEGSVKLLEFPIGDEYRSVYWLSSYDKTIDFIRDITEVHFKVR